MQAGQWWKEGLAGRWLLCPEVVDGLDVLEGPKFEKYVVKEDIESEDSDVVYAENDD